ncbi:GMC family oxidoreductase [Ferruginibacter paludis]|uniref:GMC oxidoreductase n=1 Tax=Ferruginibacter paludis TaxID=1310417 RepID=UPI0025B2E98D|nr:GMC family oxidoreductase [Ferruginibacter paludis]MDN3659470.1 GMC family oxidoreductase [Ferruginibacter paludis]
MPGDSTNINNKSATQNTYDAIVIGSGISGGWAAKELTEKGLKVLMLERGRPHEHIKDYASASKDPWDFPHRGKAPLQYKKDNPVISRDWAMYGTAAQEAILDSWVNEKECPYVQEKPFAWWRSYQFGGRSLLWGRQSYRLSDLDFEANAKDGIAIDWPIRYKEMAPWYDYVEKFAGISGSIEGLPHLPDGHFLPPMELNVVEKDVAARIKQQYKDRHMIIGRVANLTAPLQARTQCQYRNRCWEGCPFGGYFSTQSSTFPAATATGNLTVRPWSIVTKIIYDKNTKKATGVEVLDAENNKTYEFHAKILFLNASALNSAWVLMNSATDIWPDGLGSSSGELGHNVMDHHYMLGAQGTIEGFEDKTTYGRRANGFYITRFANLYGDKRDFLRGYGYQGSASREGWSREVAELNIGGDFKEALTEPGAWSIGATGFGEILPYHDNKISLHKTVKDKWGLPVLSMDAGLKENELKMRKDIIKELVAMFEAAGVKNITTWDKDYNIGQGIHEMGTARMGNDPKTSVLNSHNQVWDALNVFVTDGAAMTSSACQNPSLTYMALTARAAEYAVSELKKGNI